MAPGLGSLCCHFLQFSHSSDWKDPSLGLSFIPGSPSTGSVISMFWGVNRASLISFLFPFTVIIIHLVTRASCQCLLALPHKLCVPQCMRGSVWPQCMSKMALWPCVCGSGPPWCHQRTAGGSPEGFEVKPRADVALCSGLILLVSGQVNSCPPAGDVLQLPSRGLKAQLQVLPASLLPFISDWWALSNPDQ